MKKNTIPIASMGLVYLPTFTYIYQKLHILSVWDEKTTQQRRLKTEVTGKQATKQIHPRSFT